MDFIDRVAGWYIGIFRWFAFLGFFGSLVLTIAGIFNLFGETASPLGLLQALAMPLWILAVGNFAVIILMYQHLKSIDSKRL